MKRIEHIIDGALRVHYDGPQCFNGMALCGQDILGDAMAGESWGMATPSQRRVNCPHCMAIVRHVRGTTRGRE